MIDKATPPFLDREGRNNDATDIYQGVKCKNCGQPLGLLANIDEATYAIH